MINVARISSSAARVFNKRSQINKAFGNTLVETVRKLPKKKLGYVLGVLSTINSKSNASELNHAREIIQRKFDEAEREKTCCGVVATILI